MQNIFVRDIKKRAECIAKATKCEDSVAINNYNMLVQLNLANKPCNNLEICNEIGEMIAAGCIFMKYNYLHIKL